VLAAQPAGPVKFVVGALRRLDWTWKSGGRSCLLGPFAHTCASVVVVSMGPSVVGRDWSPVSSNKARRGYCCRTSCRPSSPIAAGERGVQPGGMRYLRVCGTSRADSRRSRAELVPRPQALPVPAAAPVLYVLGRWLEVGVLLWAAPAARVAIMDGC
jgi:hypothetical protein